MPCSKERRHSLENLKTLFFLSTGSLCFYFLLFCYIYILIYLYIDIYIYIDHPQPEVIKEELEEGRQAFITNILISVCYVPRKQRERSTALWLLLSAPCLPHYFLSPSSRGR